MGTRAAPGLLWQIVTAVTREADLSTSVRITAPYDGDILNRHDGTVTPQGLEILVRGEAPEGREVSVVCEGTEGGRPTARVEARASRDGLGFEARVVLQGKYNIVWASDGESRASARVLWDRGSVPRYRFSIDDNILFLKDLAQGDYGSLFDHWYLAFWKSLHKRYGTKVHINIYYQTDESVCASGRFDLSQMPDRYKGEWRDNSDWLRLTFHAWQNKPDRPYKDATYERVAHDYQAVTEQIRRFAGEELLSTFTTVHWAEAPREAVRALRDRGVKGLIGIFERREGALPNTRYYLPGSISDRLATRDYWWDPDMDVIFVSCDAVVNGYRLDEVVPRLEEVGSSAHTAEVIELLIHEQYFRRELPICQPDVQAKVTRAVEWVTRRGYRPTFWGSGFIGSE